MQPLDSLKDYYAVYDLRDTRIKFIPLEKIGNDPSKYGFSFLKDTLPQDYHSNAQQEAFLRDDRQITAIIAANRCGKSEPLPIKAIKILERQKKQIKAEGWFLTESYKLQKSGIQTKIDKYFKPERIDFTSIKYITRGIYESFVYVNKYGVRIPIAFKTYDQSVSNLQAASLLFGICDEEPPETHFDEIYMRIADTGGFLGFGFCPTKGITWSKDRIFHGNPKYYGIYKWGMIDNPFVSREFIEEIKRSWSPKKVRMRVIGDYVGSDKQVYYTFDRNRHVKPDLFDTRLDVAVSVDWGINVTCVGFFQQKTFETAIRGQKRIENYLIDAMELEDLGYGQVMRQILSRITSKGYFVQSDAWYCDPAGRARSQQTKIGTSILKLIEIEYNVFFRYIIRVGIEESIDIVDAWFCNANNYIRLYFQEGITLNSNGATPQMRIEGYLRDEKTNLPVKDSINDHFCDMLRYYVYNIQRPDLRGEWKQS